MSNTQQDRQISRDAAHASAGQSGPKINLGQVALQLYIAAVAGHEPAPRSGVGAAPYPSPVIGEGWSMTDATVSSAMTTNVVTVGEDESFTDVLRALAEHHISAAPVVDGRNVLLGIVSEADLLAEVASPRSPRRTFAAEVVTDRQVEAQVSSARHLMTFPVVTVRPDESLLSAARRAAKARVKRLPVVDSAGHLVGIISRSDLVAAIVGPSITRRPARPAQSCVVEKHEPQVKHPAVENDRNDMSAAHDLTEGTAIVTNATQNVIVVGVDGSPSADQAALWAAAEAQRRGATLRLVHAYSIPALFYGPGAPPEGINHVGREAAAAVLDRTGAAIKRAYPGVEVTTLAREASAVDALRTASEHALFTVVGSHGSHQVIESLLGSVAARVSGHAHSPVVVIRTDPTGRRVGHSGGGEGPIVVGLDGSAESDDALDFALRAAAIRRTSVVAIRAWDDTNPNAVQRIHPTVVDAEHEERQRLADQLLPWATKYPEVPVQQLVLRGRPAAALLRFCEPEAGARPALLVVGSRGRGGFAGMLLGSTSHALVARATCGVAIVRPDPSR